MSQAVKKGSVSTRRHASHRWLQLALGVLCMTMVANLQYGWTLFVDPMQAKFGWERAAIQVAFSVFVVAETWLTPFEGYLEDRFGPAPLLRVGGLLVGLAWVMNSKAQSLPLLYIAQAIGGVGAGAVYATCVGNALKWFPDHRGLAAGITAAGFGMGSALTIAPISMLIGAKGFEQAFLDFGLLQGAILFLASFGLASPHAQDDAENAALAEDHRHRQFAPLEIVKAPVFWLMYAMFVMIAAGGLMATAQLASIAKDYGLAEKPVEILDFAAPALTFALSFDRVLNGITRPLFGWISDGLGRENTMFLAFTLEGTAILALAEFGGRSPGLSVLLTGLVFFAWGEIYSLFPATCADTFGTKYAATNAALLYTAKGTAALLVPLSTLLASSAGWHVVFHVAAAMNLVTAALALLALRPMRARHLAEATRAEEERRRQRILQATP